MNENVSYIELGSVSNGLMEAINGRLHLGEVIEGLALIAVAWMAEFIEATAHTTLTDTDMQLVIERLAEAMADRKPAHDLSVPAQGVLQ